jgi:hypothetical protein
LSSRGPCDELITRPEESYRLWCVVRCDLEISCMRRPWPIRGLLHLQKLIIIIINKSLLRYYILRLRYLQLSTPFTYNMPSIPVEHVKIN